MNSWQSDALEVAKQIEHDDTRVQAVMLAAAGDTQGLRALRDKTFRSPEVSADDHRLVLIVVRHVAGHY
jgi:hypothetical protein